MLRFAPIACLLTIAGTNSAAMAGGFNAVSQVPGISRAAGMIAIPSVQNSFHSDISQGFASGAGTMSATGMTVSNSDGVTVQTKIDNSHNVQAGTNVSVNETINGQRIGSAYNDADFLNVQNAANANASQILAQRQAANQEVEQEIEAVIQAWQSQGY